MDNKVSASARVTLTVEVDVGSTWGEACQLKQIHKQASEEAVGALMRHIHSGARGMRIVGKPNVTAVLVAQGSR